MNKASLFFGIFIIGLLTGCASLGGIKSGTEAQQYKFENLDTKVFKEEAMKGTSAIVAMEMDSLQSGSSASGTAFSNSNNIDELTNFQSTNHDETSSTHIDSLRQSLLDEGSVKINPNQAYLIEYLRPRHNPDTLFLANLYVETGKRGIPIAFQYKVNKDDQIFFEFENQKSKTIQKIEIIEGAESRFNHVNLKKKKKIVGSLTIQTDNIMTINVVKSGFFKSVVKMKIRKLSKPQSYSVEMVNDTLVETRTVVEEVRDTLFTKVAEKNYSLSPRLDITHVNRMDFPVEINEVENLIGWGYWLGLDRENIEKYKNLALSDEESEPLISFIKSELNIREDHTYLPGSKNLDVDLQIKKLVPDPPSLNTAKNYGYYSCNPNSQNQKVKIYLANQSKIYHHDISLLVVAVNVEYSQKEVEKEFYTVIPRLKLSLSP